METSQCRRRTILTTHRRAAARGRVGGSCVLKVPVAEPRSPARMSLHAPRYSRPGCAALGYDFKFDGPAYAWCCPLQLRRMQPQASLGKSPCRSGALSAARPFRRVRRCLASGTGVVALRARVEALSRSRFASPALAAWLVPISARPVTQIC